MKKTIGKAHKMLSKKRFIVDLVIKIRNQCRMLIGYYLTDTIDFNKNGEGYLLDFIEKELRFIIDVGANVGNYVDYVIHKKDGQTFHIDAYEPSEISFSILQEKFSHSDSVNILNRGLGEEVKNIVFYEDLNFSETSSIIEENITGKCKKEILAKIETLDNLYFSTDKIVDFVKIDTEGNDFNVLLGASKLLKNCRIRFIQFEYNESWRYVGGTLIHCINFLKSFGYETYIIRPKGLYELDYTKYGEFYRYTNFFAYHEKEHHFIKPLLKGKF